MEYRFAFLTTSTALGIAVLGLSSEPVLSPETAWKVAIAIWAIGVLGFVYPYLRRLIFRQNQTQLIPIADALDIIKRHHINEWGDEKSRNAQAPVAAELLRLAASREEVAIEGHEQLGGLSMNNFNKFSNVPVKIPHEYWVKNKFKLNAILNRKARIQVETEPDAGYGGINQGYGMLRVDKEAVKARWPTPILRYSLQKIFCWRRDEPQASD